VRYRPGDHAPRGLAAAPQAQARPEAGAPPPGRAGSLLGSSEPARVARYDRPTAMRLKKRVDDRYKLVDVTSVEVPATKRRSTSGCPRPNSLPKSGASRAATHELMTTLEAGHE
jgi:hypothetical protein